MLQKNLTYKVIDRWHSDEPMVCENCGRMIKNICKVESSAGSTHYIGDDCAVTLTGIDEYVGCVFQYATQLYNKVRTRIKKYGIKTMTVTANPAGKYRFAPESDGVTFDFDGGTANPWFTELGTQIFEIAKSRILALPVAVTYTDNR